MANNPLASQLLMANQMYSPLLTQGMAPLQAPQMIRPQVPFIPQTPGTPPGQASGTLNPLLANKLFAGILQMNPLWGAVSPFFTRQQ